MVLSRLNQAARGSRPRRRWWAAHLGRSCRPRPAVRHRIQSPRGTAHRGPPAVRQHRPLRVPQPGAPEHRHAGRQLDPVRGARRWAELLQLRHRRPLRHPHRQRRGRQGGRDVPLDVQGPLPVQGHVPLRQRPGHVPQRQEPELLPDLPAGPDQGRTTPRSWSRTGRSRRPTSARRRCPTTPRCATRRPRASAKNVKSFAGQAEDPFFLDLRVFDLLYGGDLSEVGDDTLAGSTSTSVALQVPRKMARQERQRQEEPGHRHLVDDVQKKSVGGGYRPGLPPGHARWSTRSSSR